jgi:hypothetical protein
MRSFHPALLSNFIYAETTQDDPPKTPYPPRSVVISGAAVSMSSTTLERCDDQAMPVGVHMTSTAPRSDSAATTGQRPSSVLPAMIDRGPALGLSAAQLDACRASGQDPNRWSQQMRDSKLLHVSYPKERNDSGHDLRNIDQDEDMSSDVPAKES